LQVNLIHMAAIGLAVGLVIVLNNPFRGQTSVDAPDFPDHNGSVRGPYHCILGAKDPPLHPPVAGGPAPSPTPKPTHAPAR
jgi:hypothetical protein